MERRRWLVLLGAALAFMAGQGFARFGLTLILPDMRVGLGMDYGDLGLVAGVGFTAYLVAAAPAGAATARFGPRVVVSGSLATSAAGLALTGLAPDLPVVLAAQALNGAAGAGIIVPVLGLTPGWFPPHQWARSTGVVVAGGGAGLVTSGLLVPIALRAGGPSGWRLAWLALAAALLVVSLLSALLIRGPPASQVAPRQRLGLQAVYRSAEVWYVGLAFLFYGVAYAAYGTFFGARIVLEGRLDSATAGQLWALGGLASTGSGLLGGWLADRFGRRGPLVALFTVQGIALAGLAFGGGVFWYVVSVILYGATVWGFPALFTAAVADAIGPELTPAAVGLTVLCFAAGQAAGPPVVGALAQASGSFGMALIAGVAADVAGVLVALTLIRTSPLASASQQSVS